MFVSLLPPCVGSERPVVVVDCLVRGVAIADCIGINTTVGTTDNTVVATIGVGVIVGVIPWQGQGRHSIGCFHSLSTTVVDAAAKAVGDVAAISGNVALK